MPYSVLADVTLIIHTSIAVFLLIGQGLIVLGGLKKWFWIRNLWFRLGHLMLILVVTMESWVGVQCPLTTLESWLRRRAGEEVYQQSFIADWLGRLLFCSAPEWVFTLTYTLFGLVVVASWLIWPPGKRRNAPLSSVS